MQTNIIETTGCMVTSDKSFSQSEWNERFLILEEWLNGWVVNMF